MAKAADTKHKFHGDMTEEEFIKYVEGLHMSDLLAEEDYTSGRLGLTRHNEILRAEIAKREATAKN